MQANQEFLHGLVKKAEHQCHDTGYNQPSFWYGYEMQKAAMYKAARDDERRKKQESGGMSPLMMAALGAGGLGAGYGLHNMMSGSGDIPIEPGSLGMQGPGEMPSGPSIGLAEALSNFYPGGEKERSQAAVRGGINDMYHKLMSYLPRTETSQSLPPADIANSFDQKSMELKPDFLQSNEAFF